MLSKSQIKLINSLYQKKYRNQHQLFVAEGVKVINELLKSEIELEKLYCTIDFSQSISDEKVCVVSEAELRKISNLKTPNQVLGLFKIPQNEQQKTKGLTLVLDAINDPGNLGTIIRLCDWFGVSQLICSKDTVDCYNPKVVQASMGSLTRVSVFYTDLKPLLTETKLPIYAAVMNGKNVYESELIKDAILVMGNEANGISNEILDLISNTITIPRFGAIQQTESLNVATATAILLSEFKRG